jgi:meso-butanediol dehydrogenase/(S,S)-butanediol dehydrogenase/diacetyl reductase
VTRRVAVVTGASRGLGRGIAAALADSGCDVVVNWSSSEVEASITASQVESFGRRAVLVRGDVSDPATSDALVDAAMSLGGLDVWVNNAGVSHLARVVDTDAGEFERMLQVNVMGTFHGLRAAASGMIETANEGRIINVASELGVQAVPYLGAYSATKFAVVGLTQAAAIELAPHRITVNAIGPGTAETEMIVAERESESGFTDRSIDEIRKGHLDAIPLGRFCEPGDAGSLVAWLAGPGASFITGQALLVNGGAIVH